MYNILKEISENKGWVFQYGRRDFANLYDEMEQGEIHIFLDPVEINNVFDDFNTLESIEYSGSLMMVVNSDFDQDYLTKYVENIKPIIDGGNVELMEALGCHPDYSINLWKAVEVINILDMNFDGLLINYTIVENVI